MVPLTTVGVDGDKAAQRILAELLRMIEGAEPPANTVILPGTELIIRRSYGPRRPQTNPGSSNISHSDIEPNRKDGNVCHPIHPTQVPHLHCGSCLERVVPRRCGGGDGGGDGGTAPAAPQSASQVPQSEIDNAINTETTLTFWTWVPDIKNEIKLFTTKYPKIKVNLVNVGQGAPHYQKLRTAIQAGQGAPDVAQVEFQFINSFTLGEGDLLDLTPHVPAKLKDSYPEWVWSQVNTNGGLWGIPQDTGPMGLLYRDDLLTAGWARGAEDLRRLRCRSSRPTTRRIRRATWSMSHRTSPVSSSPTCGRPVSGRSPSTVRRASRSILPTPKHRRWPSSGVIW